jgi:hypothetical protein
VPRQTESNFCQLPKRCRPGLRKPLRLSSAYAYSNYSNSIPQDVIISHRANTAAFLGRGALESTASALRRRFEQLLDATDPADRGRRFEKLLRHRLTLEGFHVELNPDIAAPRQTDLFARLSWADYVIEVKWQADKIGIADIDNPYPTPTHALGCGRVHLQMSDYSEHAINQVVQDRTREILLFNAAEINAIFQQRVQVAELLSKKRDALRINARVLFTDPPSAVTAADPLWPTSKY